MSVKNLVVEKMKKAPKKVTKSQILVADYLINNAEKSSYMTAGQIGMEVGVSETTVIRFAMTLGYKRFSDLQEEFREHVIQERSVQRLHQASEEVKSSKVYVASMEKDIQNIRNTLMNIKEDVFDQVVELVSKAKNTYVIGFRSSTADAFYLSFSLNIMLENVKPVTDTGLVLEECLKNADEDSVIIAFSYPRYTRFTVEAVEYLKKEKNCKVIAITDSVQSPIIPLSDHVMFTEIDSLTPKDSHVASLALSNALISAIGQKEKKRVEENLNSLEDYFKKINIFYQNS